MPIEVAVTREISFAASDSLLPPEKIDTAKLESIYRQFGNFDWGQGALTINKDKTFRLQFIGWIQQSMSGNWYIKNDTLNCYVTSAHASHDFIAEENKFGTFKFVLINQNLYPVGDAREPYFCKKIYDYFIASTHQNL